MTTETKTVYNIYFDKDHNYVVMKWNGYATTQQFKEGTEKMLELLIENKASKVLADTKEMDIIGIQDQRWVESVFLPQAIKNGFKAIALVKPRSYFNAVAIESLSYKAGKEKMLVSIFDDINDAKNWLKSLEY